MLRPEDVVVCKNRTEAQSDNNNLKVLSELLCWAMMQT